MEPLKLDSTWSLAGETIVNYLFLQGHLKSQKTDYTEREIHGAATKVLSAIGESGESLFSSDHLYARSVSDFVWYEGISDHLEYLKAVHGAYEYEPNAFMVTECGLKKAAESALRFAVELPRSAKAISKVLDTDLESVLLAAVKIVLPRDPYVKK